MTQHNENPASMGPAVPAGMTRREYRAYLASQQQAPAAPTVQPISHFTADVADVARAASAEARSASEAAFYGHGSESTVQREHAPRLRRRDLRAARTAGNATVPPRASATSHAVAASRPAPVIQAPAVDSEASSGAHFSLSPARSVSGTSLGVVGNSVTSQMPTRAAVEAVAGAASTAAGSAASSRRPAAPPRLASPFGKPTAVPGRLQQQTQNPPRPVGAPLQIVAPVDDEPVTTGPNDVIPLISRRDSRGRKKRRVPSFGATAMLPKVGMVGVLGVASVVSSMGMTSADDEADGLSASIEEKTSGSINDVVAEDELPALDAVAPVAQADGSELRLMPPSSGSTVVVADGVPGSVEELAEIRQRAEAASRDFNRSALPDCDATDVSTTGANGRLDRESLCDLWAPGHQLRADAAVAFAELNEVYRAEFGEDITITDSYRTYAQQVSVKRRKPALAAVPGTSEHGWGMAVDLGGGIQTAGPRYQWMRANAPRFGWDNPEWARSGGTGAYEPWHWEFTPGS